MKHKLTKIMVSLTALLALPYQAFAVQEVFTYGNGKILKIALTKLALINSDMEFQALAGIMAILGIFGGGAIGVARAYKGSWKFDIVPIFGAPLLGYLLFFSLFTKTEDVIVSDLIYSNQVYTVPDVPQGIAYVASAFSKIRVGFVEIVNTTTIDGEGYTEAIGGIGLKSAEAVALYGVDLVPQHMKATIRNYVEDCVLFDMALAGSTIRPDFMQRADIREVFSAAQNPAIFTQIMDAGSVYTRSASCPEAQLIINNYMTSDMSRLAREACLHSGYFDKDDPIQVQQCVDTASSALRAAMGASAPTADTLAAQNAVTNIFFDTLKNSSLQTRVELEGNQAAASQMFGVGAVAAEWIPIIIGVLEAVIYCLIPFVALFAPLVGVRAFGLACGLILFVNVWWVTDAIAHDIAFDVAKRSFPPDGSGSSLSAMLAFPSNATKAALSFQMVRSSSIMLASLVSVSLFRFASAQLMSGLAGAMTQHVNSAGAQAGSMATPEGTAAELDKLQNTAASQAQFSNSRYDFRQAAQGIANNRIEAASSGIAKTDAWGMGLRSGQDAVGMDAGKQAIANSAFGGDRTASAAAAASVATFATQDGVKSVAVHDGKTVQSTLRSGHSQEIASGDESKPTLRAQDSDLGGISIGVTKGLQHQLSQTAQKLTKKGEQLNSNFSAAESLTAGHSKSSSDAVKSVYGNNAERREAYNRSEAAVSSSESSAVRDIMDYTGWNQKDSETFMKKITANAELKTPELLSGYFSAKIGGELNKTWTQEQAREHGAKISDSLNRVVAARDNHSNELSNARSYAESHGFHKEASAIAGYQSALSTQKTVGEGFTEHWAQEQSFAEMQQSVANQGSTLSATGNDILLDRIGRDTAKELMAGGGQGETELVRLAAENEPYVVKELSKAVGLDALNARIDASSAGVADVEQRVNAGRQEAQSANLASDYAKSGAQVDATRRSINADKPVKENYRSEFERNKASDRAEFDAASADKRKALDDYEHSTD